MQITKSIAAFLILTILGPLVRSQERIDKPQLARRVRIEFLHAWNGYKKYAWGHDDLKPLSKTYHDWYAEPLLMTPVDALDTMVLMGMKDEAKHTRAYIDKNLSFDKNIYVQNFEITIRLLGGLLSCYQLTVSVPEFHVFRAPVENGIMIWATRIGKLGNAPYIDIQTLANETGGELLADKPENLNTTFQTLMDHLRSRYNLAFVSSNKKRDGTTRKLKIDVSPPLQKSEGKLIVKARRSYVAPRS
jgi:hypothetical protein